MGFVTAHEVSQFLGGELLGANLEINKVCAIQSPAPNGLAFAKSKFHLPENAANLVLCTQKSYAESVKAVTSSFIICKNPRLAFAKVANRFFVESASRGIHNTAVVAESANIHPSVSIGAYCVIAPGVSIGEGSTLGHHTIISENVTIGKFCRIKSGAVIGEEGFGFDFEQDGTPVRIPHQGAVDIGDYAEVGSNTTIARGTFENTIIGSHVKIDDQVHIAHNCKVGEKSILTACAELSGGVELEGKNWIGPNASIMQKITIGTSALVGIGATVARSVSSGISVMGISALPLKALAKIHRWIKGAT